MATRKSIVEIDVRDEPFKKFAAAFARYSVMLTGAVVDTKALDKAQTTAATKATKAAEAETVAIVGKRRARKAAAEADSKAAAEAEAARKKAAEDEKKRVALEKKERDDRKKADDLRKKNHADVVKGWKDIAKWSGDTALNIAKGGLNLAKWATIGAIGGGFGLGGLAASTAELRRASQGLGVDTGELRAARVNFGKYVDSDSALTNIANAQSDVSKRWIFDAVGENTAGKNPGDILPDILPKLVQAFKAGGSTTQGADARGLTQLVGVDDLRRLSALTSDELTKTIEAYRKDRAALGNSDEANRDWQEFLVSLHRAGQTIESALVDGLRPLLPGLEKFSQYLSSTIKAFLSGPELGEYLKAFGDGVEHLGKFLGSQEFRDDVGHFFHALHKMATWLGRLFPDDDDTLKTPAGVPQPGAAPPTLGDKFKAAFGVYSAVWDHLTGNTPLSERNHNPGNLRVPGSSTQFQSFANDDDGVRAIAKQLQLYESRDGLDTISKILAKYSPSTENNTAGLIKAASERTGYGANDHLDLTDKATLAKLVAAITKQENGRSNFTPAGVRIAIENNTGGSVSTTVAAMNGAR